MIPWGLVITFIHAHDTSMAPFKNKVMEISTVQEVVGDYFEQQSPIVFILKYGRVVKHCCT